MLSTLLLTTLLQYDRMAIQRIVKIEERKCRFVSSFFVSLFLCYTAAFGIFFLGIDFKDTANCATAKTKLRDEKERCS